MPCIEEYRKKLDPDTLYSALTAITAEVWVIAGTWQVVAHRITTLVGSICNVYSVSTIFIPAYIAFAEQVAYVVRTYHPSIWPWFVDYARELMILADKWKGRGLDREVLLEIAQQLGAGYMWHYL